MTDEFTIKTDEPGLSIQFPAKDLATSVIFRVKGGEILRFEENGNCYIRGELVDNNKEIYKQVADIFQTESDRLHQRAKDLKKCLQEVAYDLKTIRARYLPLRHDSVAVATVDTLTCVWCDNSIPTGTKIGLDFARNGVVCDRCRESDRP